jgi:hypothetical protein
MIFWYNPDDYQVGSTIFVRQPSGWSSWVVKEFTVSKKTPSGQIVAGPYRINARGRFIGGGERSRLVICSAEEAAEIRAEGRLEAIWNTIRLAGRAIETAAAKQDADALAEALIALAQGTEARRAETGTGSVYDGPVGLPMRPKAGPPAKPSKGD